METTKLCKKCNVEKPLSEMVKRGDAHKPQCKACKNAAERERIKSDEVHREKERLRGKAKYQKNKEKHCAITKRYYQENLEWRKDLHLQNTYGITMDDKIRMREEQNNRCAICEDEFENDRCAYVDHDHTTKKVRGLLCQRCNTGYGMFRDNVSIVRRALAYGEKHATPS
jgi:hypothetical protein